MKIFSGIVAELTALDLRRKEIMQQLQAWEEQHCVPEDPAADPE